jgi:hypothetical protein
MFVGTGVDPGFISNSAPTRNTGSFGNTCEVDAEVAIGGCKTQVSTTRGNVEWIQRNYTQQPSILYLP